VRCTSGFEKFADGFGEFGQTQVGEITGNLADEFKLGAGEAGSGKGNFRWLHGSVFIALSEKEENVPRKM
jgi:hypothetical protein